MPTAKINLDDFPDSAYAQELQRHDWDMRFRGALETEFSASYIQSMRLRTQVWFTLSLVLIAFFSIVSVRRGLWQFQTVVNVFLQLPCMAIMAWISWSDRFPQWYLRLARVIAPVFFITLAVLIAQGIPQGDDQLPGFTVNLLAVYFFTGLMWREALATVVGMIIAFSVSGILAHMTDAQLAQSLVVLGLTTLVGAIVHRDVEHSHRTSFLEAALIGELVARDGLTGLMNRRSFDEHLIRIWQQAMRDRQSVAILMVDIDHFKDYNDGFGHQAGDAALRSVARVIQSFARRPLDMAARFGGEEFAVVLYDLQLPHVRELAEHLRERVQQLNIPRPRREGSHLPVTISVGAALVAPTLGRTPYGIVQLADEALYEAKRDGRNRVVLQGMDAYRLLDTGSFRNSPLAQLQ